MNGHDAKEEGQADNLKTRALYVRQAGLEEESMKAYFTNGSPRSIFQARTFAMCLVLPASLVLALQAQVVTVTVQGRVYDTTGAAISRPSVTAVNAATGFSRSATASATGDYQISFLPVGDYTVTADKSGFQKQAKKVHLDIGASANRGLQSLRRAGG